MHYYSVEKHHFFYTSVFSATVGGDPTATDYVAEADSVNSFKNRLDKYWANQESVFNFNSELMGTGGLPVCMQ